MLGKCPKCEKEIASVQTSAVTATDGARTWKGATFSCPKCFTILSAGIDPVALKGEIIGEIADEIVRLREEMEQLKRVVGR
jgi:hypothetical protein